MTHCIGLALIALAAGAVAVAHTAGRKARHNRRTASRLPVTFWQHIGAL